ncbi:MAG: ubiquinol-cytochrome c reductase iron-sulfur subunit [Candidatus Dormibacteria bacterium]
MKRYSRRQFMVLGTGVGAGLIGVLVSIPALGFLLSPLFQQKRVSWVTVGPIDNIPVGVPTPLIASLPSDQGIPTSPEQRVVYVLRKADGTVKAFSNICTHLQCDVHWETRLQQFLCPCHGGLYDIDGKNIGGPPPQPLPEWINRITYNPATQQHVLEIQNELNEKI